MDTLSSMLLWWTPSPSQSIARRLPDNNLHCYKSTPSPSQQLASIGPSRKGSKYLEANLTKLNSKRKHSYSFQLPSISSNRTVLHPEWLSRLVPYFLRKVLCHIKYRICNLLAVTNSNGLFGSLVTQRCLAYLSPHFLLLPANRHL
jgi:hypothetical protein